MQNLVSNTMMSNKKKTNYESKGFVRRIAGSIFSSRGGGGGGISGGGDVGGGVLSSSIGKGGGDGNNKWRPRKKQFERLDVDDEDVDSFLAEKNSWVAIKSVESTESDAGEYKRAILYERKTVALKHQIVASTSTNNLRYNPTSTKDGTKRDISNFNIKPPTKDTTTNRMGSVGKTKTSKHIQSDEQHPVVAIKDRSMKDPYSSINSNMTSADRMEHGYNGPHGTNNDDDFFSNSNSRSHKHTDDESSRETSSSNITGSSKQARPSSHHPSYNTVSSDPSDFFSKDAVTTLTQQNLARMAAISAAHGTIPEEHRRYGVMNSRNKFYQFAIDEDKESTVVESNVLPLQSYGDDDGQLFGEAAMSNYDDDEEEDSDDDDSERDGSFATKGTRIQKRSPAAPTSFAESRNLSHDAKQNDDVVQNDDDTFADLIRSKNISKHSDRNDIFDFPELETDEDNFFSQNIQDTTPPHQVERVAASYGRQPSTQSLSYSPSPKHHHRKVPEGIKLRPPPVTRRFTRDGRLPLSPLSNVKLARAKSNPSLFIPRLPSTTTTGASDEFPAFRTKVEGKERKPDPDESWFDVSQAKTSKRQFHQQNMIKKPDPYSKFNAFGTFSSKTLVADGSTITKKQKRDPSMSSPFELTGGFENSDNSDPFNTNTEESDPFASMGDEWGFEENVAPQTTNVPVKGNNTKANIGMTLPKKTLNGDGPNGESIVKQPRLVGLASKDKRTAVVVNDEMVDIDSSSEDEEDQDSNKGDDDDDDDSFDSVGLWEKSSSAVPMGIQDFPKDSSRSLSTRSNGAESKSFQSERQNINSLQTRTGLSRPASSNFHGRGMGRTEHNNTDYDDNASVGKGSTSGSYAKPLALPSNAIMASMLFRTHYDNDKTTVERKIKAKEEEHVKYQKSRRGDIPDAVLADNNDYMTTISSFSDGTTTFQEAWRKPSRDLLDYFSKARALDMESKKYLQSHQVHSVKNAPLFEA